MNANIRSITTLMGVLLLFSISMNLNAQTVQTLFNVIPNAGQVLSPAERSRYAAIGEEETKEKALIEISELANILSGSAFSVPIKGVNHSMRSERFTQEKEGNFTFKGSFSETTGELYIYATNGFVYGNIHIDSLAYQIEPLNKKYALLLRRDYSGTTCPLGEEHEDGGKSKNVNNSRNNETIPYTSSANPVIDVMVVFSNQAAAATSNMQALTSGAIQSSNDAFSNSNAGATFNLIHYQQVSYNESESTTTDVNRLQNPSDGYMDNVHTLRDQYGADVVVLIAANYSGSCGRAFYIGAIASDAFAVTRDDCAIGNYSFAHEVGHLAGARHDSDGSSSPYPYGHGFRYNPGYWRTIMAVYDDVVNRINYWSNPDKYYGGIAMGSTSWRDNARVWDERAATVANFRTPPVPAPSTPTGLTITNAGSSFGSPNIDWNNNPESNINGYEVWRQQKRIIDGYTFPFSWLANTTSSAYTDLTLFFGSTNDDQYRYAVKAVDSNGNKSGLSNSTVWISGFGFLKVRPNKEAPETFALNNNYPNPFNPATTISVELPEAAVVSLRVYNVMGQQVAQLANGNYPAGYHQVTFDASKLSSGLYIARFEATGASGQLFSRDIKMQLIK